MAEFEVNTGHDTWVNETTPAQNNALSRLPAIRSGDELRILLFMPLASTRISGKTILSATLSVAVQGNWVDQTVTAQALSAEWNVDQVTYANQPGVTGATASSAATGALSAGDRFEIDVTALVQAIANGQANYGWRLTTSQTTTRSTVRGFDSGLASWTLTVEVSDLPVAPTQLSPKGVIATGTPVVTIDEVDDMAQIQVQIDAAADSASPDFDSGWRATTTPQLNLANGMARSVAVTTTNGSATITFAANVIETADIGHAITGSGIPNGTTIIARPTTTSATMSANATASASITATVTRTYAGLADAATTYWRARSKLTDTSTSDWSEWVEITRHNKPTIVMDTPASTSLFDPTPTIEAHLSPAGNTDTRWQVIVHDVGAPTSVRYNSGDALTGAALDHEIPLLWQGQKVFPDNGQYVLVVRAWDRVDRVPTEGNPTFARTSVTVTLGTSGAVTAPTAVTATQTGSNPEVVVGWSHAGTPSRFGIFNSAGEIVAMVSYDDALVSPGVFSHSFDTFTPNKSETYTVRAVADNAGVMSQSVDSAASAAMTPAVSGVWLRSDTASVKFFGRDGMDARQVDKRQHFELPYRLENVDIITAVGGFAGTFKGGLRAPSASTLAQLEAWRQSSERLRVIWGTHNILADIKGLSVTYDPRSGAETLYVVEFGFEQVPEES